MTEGHVIPKLKRLFDRCPMCGSAEIHALKVDFPTIPCLHYLRNRVEELERRLKNLVRLSHATPDGMVSQATIEEQCNLVHLKV